MRKLILISLFFIVSSTAVYAEKITLSTYYPAPFGAYDRLKGVPRDPGLACNPNAQGTFYFENADNTIQYCKDPAGLGDFELLGVWRQKNISNTNMANIYFTDLTRNINVGIGTATPGQKLQLDSLQGDETGIRLHQNGVRFWDFKLKPNDGKLYITDHPSSLPVDRMVIDTSGNVGIGTTNPGVMLEVAGNKGDGALLQ